MRKTRGYAFTDYKTNREIAKEVHITSVLEKKYRNTKEIGYNI